MSSDLYTNRRSRSPAGRIDSYRSGDRDDEGDRASYRRRSPDRRGARRSRSPPRNIDRYQPGRDARDGRDNYNPTRRDYDRRRSPPPVAQNIDRYVPGQEPPPPVVNPLPNPLTLDFQVGFTWFAEYWRKEQEVKQDKERQRDGRRVTSRLLGEREAKEEKDREREKIQIAYDEYKEKFQALMARRFTKEHKADEWFKERYDQEIRDPFRTRLAEYRQNLYNKWMSDLQEGTFDEFTLEGIYKAEADGSGGIVEKEEGEAPMANEILSTADLVPSKGGDLRDDAAYQPALLIKTIAPYISRERLEAFCKENLGEGENGFNWLSLSDPNPSKRFHRIGWVLLNSDEGDAKPTMRSNDGEGDEKMDVDDDPAQARTQAAVEAINGKAIEDEKNGNFTCHVGVHVPASQPRKKALWDLFSAPERVERDLQLAQRTVSMFDAQLGSNIDAVNKIEERVDEIRAKGLLQPAEKSAAKKEEEEPEEGEDEDDAGLDQLEDEVDDEELLTKKKRLDLLVEYLRRVFNFCFFCVFECDSVHELARKCPGGHLRRPRASLTNAAKSAARASAYGEDFPLKKPHEIEGNENEADINKFDRRNRAHIQLQKGFNWVRTFEEKLFQILEPQTADLKKLGGMQVEEALELDLAKHVKQEDESKWRCKIVPDCTKLFKGPTFWRKHVEKRHTEWFDEIKRELELVNNYVLDPAHISLQNSAAAANGHFPTNPQLQNGTPRGFSLGTHGASGMNLAAAMRNGGMDGIGPMRRGNRNNNRQQGPYDRQGASRRGQGGRLTPPRGMSSRGRGGFPDAMAGASGGREAVAGRSLKSYEDLDAADGGDAGALDY